MSKHAVTDGASLGRPTRKRSGRRSAFTARLRCLRWAASMRCCAFALTAAGCGAAGGPNHPPYTRTVRARAGTVAAVASAARGHCTCPRALVESAVGPVQREDVPREAAACGADLHRFWRAEGESVKGNKQPNATAGVAATRKAFAVGTGVRMGHARGVRGRRSLVSPWSGFPEHVYV